MCYTTERPHSAGPLSLFFLEERRTHGKCDGVRASPDLMEPMRKLAQEYGSDEVNIDVIHRFGTPEILWQLDRYDVIVARGITYNKSVTCILKSISRSWYLTAWMCWRHCAAAGRLIIRPSGALPGPGPASGSGAGHGRGLRRKDPHLRRTGRGDCHSDCGDCQADGMDALVSGGTVYNFCQERGVPCTYVHLRMETLRRTLSEAMKAATASTPSGPKQHHSHDPGQQ